jgi:hypothetical protein
VRRALLASVTTMTIATSIVASARAADQHPPPRVSLEIDPVPYLRHGYSVHVGVVPLEHVRVTLGVYGQRTTRSDPTDFEVRTRYAIVETVGAYLRSDARGFGGGLVAIQSNRELGYPPDSTITSRAELYYVGLFVTYAWFPIDAVGFYVRPWVGAAFCVSGCISVEEISSGTPGSSLEAKYDDPALVPILALHVGWEFGP